MNKYNDIVSEETTIIILYSKPFVCMANNGKDTKHTRHIYRRVHFVRNVKMCKMHNIDWCEGGLQLVDIATKNVGENDLDPTMKYIIGRLDNWERTLVQDGWQDTG